MNIDSIKRLIIDYGFTVNIYNESLSSVCDNCLECEFHKDCKNNGYQCSENGIFILLIDIFDNEYLYLLDKYTNNFIYIRNQYRKW